MSPPEKWRGPLAVGAACIGLIVIVMALSVWRDSLPGWGYDFTAYYAAAERLAQTGSPYQPETLGGPYHAGPGGLYLYSPLLALVLVPLTTLPFETATLVWFALRLGLLGLACALMPIPVHLRVVLFGIAGLSVPVLRDLNLGNVSLLVTLLAVLAWRFRDHAAAGGALAAALTMRPTMAIFLAWWALRGRWQPLAGAVIVLAAVVLLSLPLVGVQGWLDYVTVLRNLTGFAGIDRNLAADAVVQAAGGPDWLVFAASAGSYIAGGTAVLLSLRRDRELSFVVTVGATLLMSPLLWDHYLTHLLVPAAFLAARGRRWGLVLPLLCWLPQPLLSLVAVAGTWLPFLAPARGEPAGTILDRLPRRQAPAPA